MTTLLIIVFASTTLAYSAMIYWLWSGFYRLPATTCSPAKDTFFSVIVPVKNEGGNIVKLLEALRRQKHKLFEVIVVDDHSTDATASLVKNYISTYALSAFRLIDLAGTANNHGKKAAITEGVAHARGEFIVTTDGDCEMGPEWLACLNEYMDAERPDMIIGPVVMTGDSGLFACWQALEYFSLLGVTAGAAGRGQPLICSGANLAYRRTHFARVNGFEGNLQHASGDDVFLLHKIKTLPGARIIAAMTPRAVVTTKVASGPGHFLRQRARWLSKTPGYKDNVTHLVVLLTGLINLLLVAGAILSLTLKPSPVWIIAAAWFFKGLADYTLLSRVTGRLGHRKLLRCFPVSSLVYPFYAVILAGYGLCSRPGWK